MPHEGTFRGAGIEGDLEWMFLEGLLCLVAVLRERGEGGRNQEKGEGEVDR